MSSKSSKHSGSVEDSGDEFERLQVEEAMRLSLPPPPHEMPSDYDPRSSRSPGVPRRDTAPASGAMDLLYDVGNVSMETQPHASKKGKLPGRLKIIVQKQETYLVWEPKELTPATAGYSFSHKIETIGRLHRVRANALVVSTKGGITIAPLCFENGMHALTDFVGFLQSKFNFKPIPGDSNSFGMQPPDTLLRSIEGLGMGTASVVNDTFSQVKWSILTGLSKVTQLTSGKSKDSRVTSPEPLAHSFAASSGSSSMSSSLQGARSSATAPSRSEDSGRVSPATIAAIAQAEEANKEVQCRSQTDLGELGSFDIIDSMDSYSMSRRECHRQDPVTREVFDSFFNEEGQVKDEILLRNAIFHGGCAGDVRKDAWRFLHKHWPPSKSEAASWRKAKEDEYNVYKMQWKTVTPAQLRYHHPMQEFISRVRKDVDRTDREHPFFAGDGNEHIEILNDMLMSYCMYNFDLGYVQGMSDMIAVLYIVLEDEVDTFWCFANWMEKMRHNFAFDQMGMQTHMKNLANLVRFMDPEFMEAMERNDSGNLYFCFRWLLINFKREFHLNEIMTLWEVFWTEFLSPSYELFVCFAIMEEHREKLMAPGMCFDEIVQYVNSLAYAIDLPTTLNTAESWYYALAESRKIPETLVPFVKTWAEIHTLQ